MNKRKTAEAEHTAIPIIGAFIYQYYYFIWKLLTLHDGETVSFEKLDDVAIETKDSIFCFQVKHTVKGNIDKKAICMGKRDSDLWKAIDVWRKIIIQDRSKLEQKEYIKNHKFVFVSNKTSEGHGLIETIQKLKSNDNPEIILDKYLEEVLKSHREKKETANADDCKTRYRSVQVMVEDFKAFAQKVDFVKNLDFVMESPDDVEAKIRRSIQYDHQFIGIKVEEFFSCFKGEVDKDLFNNSTRNICLSYSYEERHKRFQACFNKVRSTPLIFKYDKQEYHPDFLQQKCIKQLLAVGDIKLNSYDKIAKYMSCFLSFANTYDENMKEFIIGDSENVMFKETVASHWDDEFSTAYDEMNMDASEEEIHEAAKIMLSNLRKIELQLCETNLFKPISNGAFYYFSDGDVPLIGWHRDWQSKFKYQDGQSV